MRHDIDRDRDLLLLHLTAEATRWLPRGWKPATPGELRLLLPVAVAERRNPRVRRTCAGMGEILKGGERAPSPACGGLGWRPWGARVLAECFGVARHTWETRWVRLYARVWAMLEAVEIALLGVVAEQGSAFVKVDKNGPTEAAMLLTVAKRQEAVGRG